MQTQGQESCVTPPRSLTRRIAATQAAPRSRIFRRNEDGTTAIEFAIVAVPFFMFIFGLMGVSSYFFIMTSLEKGMDQSSRMVRTGQAQTDETVTVSGDFKKAAVTTAHGGWVKCNEVQVFVQKFADWDDVQPQTALNNTAVVSTAKDNDPIAQYSGESNAIVLVTTCYRWEFAGNIPVPQPWPDERRLHDDAVRDRLPDRTLRDELSRASPIATRNFDMQPRPKSTFIAACADSQSIAMVWRRSNSPISHRC